MMPMMLFMIGCFGVIPLTFSCTLSASSFCRSRTIAAPNPHASANLSHSPGVTYTYDVTAVDAAGQSSPSNSASITVPL